MPIWKAEQGELVSVATVESLFKSCRNSSGFSNNGSSCFRQKLLALIFMVKSSRFLGTDEKCSESSKYNRKNNASVRMEIFAGTYMRPRYFPCQVSTGTMKKAEISLLCHFGFKLGFRILVPCRKKWLVLEAELFDTIHQRRTQITIK